MEKTPVLVIRQPLLTLRPILPVLLGLLALAAPLPLLAQQLPETGGGTEAAAPTEIYEVPAARSSARATFRTFLEAFDPKLRGKSADPLITAAACLDLSRVPHLVRDSRGVELAVQLKEILDRVELIDFDTIPDRASGPPYRLQVFDFGELTIAPDKRGEWRFDSATVAAIPRLYAATEDLSTVEGIVAVDRRPLSMQIRAAVPVEMRRSFFGVELWQVLGLGILLVLGWLADLLVIWLLRGPLRRQIERADLVAEPARLTSVLRPVGLIGLALVWGAGLYILGLPTGLAAVLSAAVRFILAVSVVWALYKAIDLSAELYTPRAAATGSKLDDLLLPLLRKTFKLLIFAFGLVFIADSLDLPITSLVAGLGIGGLALALAAQDTVKNFFGSLTVIIDKPFQVGDSIKVDGVEGTVTEVGFRSTRIRTFYDSYLTLPNSNLTNAAVDNLGERRFRRWKTTVGLAYDTPVAKIEAFCEGVRQLVLDHPTTRKEGFQVSFQDFGASSIDIMLYIFFEVPGWAEELEGRQKLALDVLRLAEELEIEIAFPTTTVHLRQESEAG